MVTQSSEDDLDLDDSSSVTTFLPPQLSFYSSLTSRIYPVDTFIADGVNSTYNLVNLTGLQVGTTIEVNNQLLYGPGGAFTVVGNSVILSFIPPAGNIIVVVGTGIANIPTYDSAGKNIVQVPFYIIDNSTILTWSYSNSPALSGIQIGINDLITGVGATTSWIQFALANADGTHGTFQSPTVPLELTNISANNTLNGSIILGATSVTLHDSTGFLAGDVVQLNPQQVNQETVHCSNVVGNVLTIDATQFAHADGEPIYVNGKKFWIQETTPLGVVGTNPANLYNLDLLCTVRTSTR